MQFLPRIPVSDVRTRLTFLTVEDISSRPLTQKILERPRFLNKLCRMLDSSNSCIVCFNSTDLEKKLSVSLGIPLLAMDPSLNRLGTKSGSREVFSDCGLDLIPGSKSVNSINELTSSIIDLYNQNSWPSKIIIKLDTAFSGLGNAILDTDKIFQPLSGKIDSVDKHLHAYVSKSLASIRFSDNNISWEDFESQLCSSGAIAEIFVESEMKTSPSVQGYISPGGFVEILSTHEQLLGGFDGLIYEGCIFPANSDYRLELQRIGTLVGEYLSKRGVIDHFSVDFLATRVDNNPNSSQSWKLTPLEINLRKGGTTHPPMILRLLTNGTYDLGTGLFYDLNGKEKYYVSTDNLWKKKYIGTTPFDLFNILANSGLSFDSRIGIGVFIHLIGSMSEFGKLGVTCISNTSENAHEIYRNFVSLLDSSCI